MLPIRDSTRRQRIPLVTVALIAANVIAFLFWQPTLRHVKDAELAQQTFFWCHGQIPYELAHLVPLARSGANGRTEIAKDYDVTTADAAQLQDYLGRACPRKNIWLSIVTAMFLHAGWLHLGGNMLFLWIFGDNVEDALGKLGYLAFYLVGGVAAGALQFVLAPNSTIPNAGAPGPPVSLTTGAELFDQLGAGADRVQLVAREPLQIGGEDPGPLPPSLRADASPSDRRTDQHAASIVGVGRPFDQGVPLKAVDEPRHRRSRHALGRRQGADPDWTGVDDGRERRQAG